MAIRFVQRQENLMDTLNSILVEGEVSAKTEPVGLGKIGMWVCVL